MFQEGVNHHVARPGIEREYFVELRPARNDGDVPDAAEIERHASPPFIPVQHVVNKRHQRRALSADGDICGTKISHGGNSRPRGDRGGLADLHRGGDSRSQIPACAALVVNRLSVRPDQCNPPQGNSKPAAGFQGCLREKLAQPEIQLADLARCRRAALSHPQDSGTNFARKGKGNKVLKRSADSWRRARNLRQRHVNSVGGSPRHQTEDEHRERAHEICFFNSASRLSASTGFSWSRSAWRSASSTARSRGVKSACCLPFESAPCAAPGVSFPLN